jgi:hypothetical protein
MWHGQRCSSQKILSGKDGWVAEARVKAGLWVSAALRLAFNGGRGGAVLRRGDADAGGILVVLRGEQGLCVLSQVSVDEGERAWMRATGPQPVAQDVADSYVARQLGRDPDLWVVEFDAPDYLPPFGGRIV